MSCRHVVVVLFIANHRWPLNRSPLRRFSPLRFPACTAPLKGFADTQGLTKGLPAHTKGLPRACWHTRRAYQGLARYPWRYTQRGSPNAEGLPFILSGQVCAEAPPRGGWRIMPHEDFNKSLRPPSSRPPRSRPRHAPRRAHPRCLYFKASHAAAPSKKLRCAPSPAN